MDGAGSKRKPCAAPEEALVPAAKRTRGATSERPIEVESDDDGLAADTEALVGPDTQKRINGARIQVLLSEGKYGAVLHLAKQVGTREIDFRTVYAPPPFESCLHSLVYFLAADIPVEYALQLLQLYKDAGIVTREMVSYAYAGTNSNSMLILAATVVGPHAFDFCVDNLPPEVADWCAVHPRHDKFPTALHTCVGIRTTTQPDAKGVPLTEELRAEYDRRGAKLVALLPDDALNFVDQNGDTPLCVSIENARVLTLQALIGRMPAVELQSNNIDRAMATNNAEGASFKPLRPLVVSLVAVARASTTNYHKGLLPLLLLRLKRRANIPHELVVIIHAYVIA